MDVLSKLIVKAQKGDQDAFGKIYKTFYERIFRYCKFNCTRQEAAQDICQETFLRAWKFLPSFSLRKGGSFQAFLFKIARNLIIDLSRKKKEVPLAQYKDLVADEDLTQNFQRAEDKKRVELAILHLNEIEKQIVVLRYFEEMTSIEVAKIIGIREGALRVRTHRILKKLREIIKRSQ